MIKLPRLDVNHEDPTHIQVLVLKHALDMELIEALEKPILHADANQDLFIERKIKQLKDIMYLKKIAYH